MAINVVPLDNSHENDQPTVLVGKDILIMFKPIIPALKDTIKFAAPLIGKPDLLLQSDILENLRKLQLLTDEIVDMVSSAIQIRDTQSFDPKIIKDIFKFQKREIKERASEISKIEDKLKLYFAEDHRVYFCNDCDTYLGLATDALPEKCKICNKQITKDISGADSIRYLNSLTRNYLQGIWLQDYVAKILKMMSWETWTECSVMGASGVYHSIDILAIDKINGKVVIVECKRSASGDHAFKLAARFSDIQPSFGLLISLNKLNSEDGKNLLTKKPGLKLIELSGLSDEEIKTKLHDFISREN